MASYTIPRTTSYSLLCDGTGTPSDVGKDGQYKVNDTYMGESKYDLTAFQALRAGRNVTIKSITMNFMTACTYNYMAYFDDAMITEDPSETVISAATTFARYKGTQTSYHWLSATVTDANICSALATMIDGGAQNLYFLVTNYDYGGTGDGYSRYMDLYIEYEWGENPQRIIQNFETETGMVTTDETMKFSLDIYNCSGQSCDRIKLYLSRYNPVSFCYTVRTTIVFDAPLANGETKHLECEHKAEFYIRGGGAPTGRSCVLYLCAELYSGTGGSALVTDIHGDFVTWVNKYYSPAIDIFSVERCSSTGTKADDGGYVCTDCKLSLNSTTVDSFTLKAYYDEGAVDISSSPYVSLSLTDSNLADYKLGYIDSTTLITQAFDASKDYAFKLVLSDGVESAVADGAIFKAFANVHLSGATTGGVRLGGISRSTENNPLFECDYPATFASTITASGGITGCDYSTTETATPFKWVDGKTVYRRVFYHEAVGTNFPNTFYFSTIPDLDVVIRCTGVVWNPGNGGQYLPIPYNVGGSNWVDIQIQGDQGNLVYMYQGTGQSIQKAYIIVEYTKTTT